MSIMGPPSASGRFGEYGGRFVPESLIPACFELEAVFNEAWGDPEFVGEYRRILSEFGGRPTPVTELRRFSEKFGVRVFLKREDLAHTGSHKINNVIGQALLTRRMGKTRLIAETGAGQHGVATATAAALLGLECVVYMELTASHQTSFCPSEPALTFPTILLALDVISQQLSYQLRIFVSPA